METDFRIVLQKLLYGFGLVGERLSSTMWMCFAQRAWFTNSLKKAMNSALVCRFAGKLTF